MGQRWGAKIWGRGGVFKPEVIAEPSWARGRCSMGYNWRVGGCRVYPPAMAAVSPLPGTGLVVAGDEWGRGQREGWRGWDATKTTMFRPKHE